MEQLRLHRINSLCLIVSLVAIAAGVLVGLLGIWGVITTADGLLWKALGTCGAFFVGSVLASMALGCFKTNE